MECAWCRSRVEGEPVANVAASGDFDSPPPPPPLPDGWIRTVDSWAGYSVGHPQHWAARWENGVITVGPDGRGTVQAFVWPVQLRSPLNAQQVAQNVFLWFKAQDPQFEAWLESSSQQFPRTTMMRTKSRAAGQQVEGVVMVIVCGSSAVISGFHAPPATQEASTLMTIAQSFRFELPAPRQRFREPREGSFDAVAPMGWQATGRTRRNQWTGMITCEYSAQKDASGLTLAAVPGDLWQFADGRMMGMLALGMMGMKKFSPAGQCGPELLAKRFKNQSNRRFVDVVECPQVFPRLYGDLARLGLPTDSVEASAACVISEHVVGGTTVRQKSFIATARPSGNARWTNQYSGQWIAELLSYYQAPVSEFNIVEPILAGVADSFQINNAWVQRERAIAMQTAMILGAMLRQQAQMQQQQQHQMAQRQAEITHTLHQTSDTIMSGWEERNRIHDHVMHQWSNATLGVTDVVDSSYGTVYSVPNDYDQYWRTNSDTIIGGSWGVQPDPSWHKLEPIKL